MFSFKNPLLIWLCGNYTIDTKYFIDDDEVIIKHAYGGSVFFGSWAITNFFRNISYKVFSNGYPHFFLTEDTYTKNTIDLSENVFNNDYEKLTHYVLDYRSEIRKLQLKFFPTGYINIPLKESLSPNIIMILPVYHEIDENAIFKLKQLFPFALLACDPQGWCRIKDPISDEIQIKQWVPSEAFLTSVSIIKMSSEDVGRISNQSLEGFIENILLKDVIFVITGGAKGNVCFFADSKSEERKSYFSPIPEVVRSGDTTGAGDVWLMSFSISYYESKSLTRALATATVLTGKKIQANDSPIIDISANEVENAINNQEKRILLLPFKEGLNKIF